MIAPGPGLWAAFLLSAPAATLTTIAVARGWGAALDRRLFDALQLRAPPRPDGKPPRFVAALRDLAALGGDMLRLLALALCVALLLAVGRGAVAGELAGLFAFGRLALVLIKRMVRRARPAAGAFAHVTYTSSFPSGHTAMSVVLFLSVALLVPANGSAVAAVAILFALVTSAAIGISRIMLGIHWPSDVVVGWLAGVALVSGALLAFAAVL
ncbi:MAG TPA: phosphatase PAP2 family protein [Sphingomonas sp.]